MVALIAACVVLPHVVDGELGLVPGLQGFLSVPENRASIFIQTELLGPPEKQKKNKNFFIIKKELAQ